MVSSFRKLSVFAPLVVCGCAATDPYTGAAQNQVIAVQYGTIENVQQVDMKAAYGKDSLLGGALGLLAASTGSTTTQIAGAALGAGLGALVGKETAGTGERYTVRLVNGSQVAVVTEQANLDVGDCVSVEQGEHTNLRRVSSVMCITPASHPAYPAMHSAMTESAGDCHKAKQDVLNAKTQAETDIALRKMRALCES